MQAGHTAIITDHSLRQLWGFIKLDPWFKPSANIPGEGIGNITIDDVTRAGLYFPVGVEVGSLVVVPQHQNKGFGKFLAKEASSLSEEIYPGIPRIAVVTNDNLSSLHVFTKIGWIGVSPEEAKYIMQGVDVLEGWTPPSTIFVDPLSFPGLHNY
jgi:GNAT superfamily N-acetyltransferase